MIERVAEGRTDLVFDFVGAANPATTQDSQGTSLIQWCAYYGDVSAIKFLVSKGEVLRALGDNLGLDAAAFHGHWRLCEFLLENGADADSPLPDTGETPLHAALSSTRRAQRLVVKVLLAHGANPNRASKPGAETGAFMRDCRTRGETPLHRAAAFADEATIQLLLDAGAKIDAKDVNGDAPLTWGSWHQRPDSILRKLCYGPFFVRPERLSMDEYLTGQPHK
ncbi:MAG TPA: ankyrin repeat domain-containing protein [Candidatus Eisenbacteria bacterium]|jgi:ankyrin repeat protein|nr:ankyrin repeat domain-containing protein [Candidatus Eisenbacteria bacterium]